MHIHPAHFFIPHKKNNYRAHLLKPIALYTVIFFMIGLQFSFLFIKKVYPQGNVLGVSYSITVQDIVTQTNDQRGKNGLAPLKTNGQLNVAAQLKGQDMLTKGYWAHVSPEGKEPWYWIIQSGYNYNRAGENLAKDFRDTTSTVTAWMNSPGHRANILNPNYKDIGVAVVSGPFNGYDTVIVVQMFGEPYGGSSASLTQPDIAGAQVLPTPKPAQPKTVNLALVPNTSTGSATSATATDVTLTKPDDAQIFPVPQTATASPLIDPIQIFKVIIFVIGVAFAVLLGVDAYIIAHNRIKRDNHGHSMYHAVFLIAIMVSLFLIETGVIL
jgi:hypothetical protein